MWPSGRFSGTESKAEAAKTAGVLFPLTPTLSLRERESAGTVLENSDVAVAVPAFLSFVSEPHDNQARWYYPSTAECFSLSWGRGLGWGNRTPTVLAVSSFASAPEDRPKGCIALSHSSFQASGFAGGR